LVILRLTELTTSMENHPSSEGQRFPCSWDLAIIQDGRRSENSGWLHFWRVICFLCYV